MGIEPFLVASSCNLIVAQRLVRRLCGKCKNEITMHEETLRELGIMESPDELTVFEAKGCIACNETGYAGRQGLYEVMNITSDIREMILERRSSTELKKQAVKDGMLTLRADGLEKFKRGATSLEEVLRETSKF
jgi:type IV pilus assembly protein PilB